MKLVKRDKSVVCHEYGHYLIYCLLGKRRFVSRIEFYGDDYWNGCPMFFGGRNIIDGLMTRFVNGEVVAEYIGLKHLEELVMLYGGCAACKVVGLRGTRIDWTDRDKVMTMTKSGRERKVAMELAVKMLTPYKALLETLTEKTFEYILNSNEYSEDGKDLAVITDTELEQFGVLETIKGLPKINI